MTRGSRTRVGVASLLLGMTALTGCAAEPLAPEDVVVSVTVDVPEQTIIGDSAEIEGAAVMPEGRDDPIDTVLEVRAPGGQWASTDSSIALDAAGQWGFRTVVRLPDIEGDFAVSSVTTIEVSDLQALVRDLYYNQRIAFQAGPEAGWDYRVAANYPGI